MAVSVQGGAVESGPIDLRKRLNVSFVGGECSIYASGKVYIVL